MHICIGKLTITDRRQAIIWTNDGILFIGPLGTNFSETLIENSNIFVQENAYESVVCETAACPTGIESQYNFSPKFHAVSL